MQPQTHADIQRQVTLAWCCLAKKQADALVKQRAGVNCSSELEAIAMGFMSLEALRNYYPLDEVIYSYTLGQSIVFTGNSMIVNSQVTSGIFYEQYDGTDSPNVASFWNFATSSTGTITNAVGSVTNFTYTYNGTTKVLAVTISGITTNYTVTSEKFFSQIVFKKANGDILTLGFYGTPTLSGGTETEVLAAKPCLSPNEAQGILNKVLKGCPCDCGEYINIQPADNNGEAIVNLMASFVCKDGEPYITISFEYSGSPTENAFSIVATSGSKEDVIYTFASTGQSDGSITATISGSDIISLANGYYNISIVDNYGQSIQSSSNTLTGIRKTSCNT